MTRSVTARVHGRVQGVGFRYSVVRAAAGLDVAGWVRNRSDGTVEVRIQGPAEAVEALIGFVRVGPRAARVDRVDVADVGPDPVLDGFGIR